MGRFDVVFGNVEIVFRIRFRRCVVDIVFVYVYVFVKRVDYVEYVCR